MEKFKLPKKVKEKWVKALRSGEFKQCESELKADLEGGGHAFCCLGVARELGLKGAATRRGYQLLREGFMPGEIQQKLAKFNDDKKWSFKKIATWIEKRL